MMQTEKPIKTPYDEYIARLKALRASRKRFRLSVEGHLLFTAETAQRGWLECYPVAFEAGIEEVKTNPELYGLAAPTKGDR